MHPFDHVWCLAHRLNLVVADFQNVTYINSVLHFARWFSSKRKAVVYKKWFRETYKNERFKKVPKPSQTRWAFYRDVLGCVLEQCWKIETFLKDDCEFLALKAQLQPLCENDHNNPSTFFSNKLVFGHFKFSFSILDKIWSVVVRMQGQYSTLPQVWSSVLHLRDEFVENLCEVRDRRFANFLFTGHRGVQNCDVRKRFEATQTQHPTSFSLSKFRRRFETCKKSHRRSKYDPE